MKIKQTNDEGEEIEVDVFSQEELDAKLEEQTKAHEAAIAEKDNSLAVLAKEKEEIAKKVGETKEDNPNFKTLKDALDKKSAEIDSLREEISSDKKNSQKEFMDTKIKSLSKGDPELEKKIRLNLETTLVGMKEDTEANRLSKLQAALKLSTDGSTSEPGMFDTGAGGGGPGSADFKPRTGNEFTPKEKALGAKMGITEEDYKKYGPRVSKRG